MDFNYRLHWTMDESAIHSPDLGWVKQTLRSTGDVKQSNLVRQLDGSVAYIVDFEGPVLAKLGNDPAIRSQVTTDDNTELVENNLRFNPETKGWRLTLRMKVKDTNKAVDMRAYLLREVPAEPGKEPAVLVSDKADKKAEKKTLPALPASKEEKAEAAKAAKADAAEAAKAADAAKAAGTKADAAKPADAKDAKVEAAKPADAKADAAKADAAKPDVAKDKDGNVTQQPEAAPAPTPPAPATTQQVLTETWSYQLPADE